MAMRDWPGWTQAFVAVPGVVAVVDSVVAGAVGGIAVIGVDWGTAAALAVGAAVFAVSLLGFVTWGRRKMGRGRKTLSPLFPTTPEL